MSGILAVLVSTYYIVMYLRINNKTIDHNFYCELLQYKPSSQYNNINHRQIIIIIICIF